MVLLAEVICSMCALEFRHQKNEPSGKVREIQLVNNGLCLCVLFMNVHGVPCSLPCSDEFCLIFKKYNSVEMPSGAAFSVSLMCMWARLEPCQS